MAIMPKNFTIESGKASLEELLAACGDGVYVFENYDQFHALNVVSGDFSFPCKAVRIKGGKPVGMMEGLTMSGTVADLSPMSFFWEKTVRLIRLSCTTAIQCLDRRCWWQD